MVKNNTVRISSTRQKSHRRIVQRMNIKKEKAANCPRQTYKECGNPSTKEDKERKEGGDPDRDVMMSVHDGDKEGNEEEYDPVEEEDGRSLSADVGQEAVTIFGKEVDAAVELGV